MRGRPCNEQHCIRAANPRPRTAVNGQALLLLRGRIQEKANIAPRPHLATGHDSDLKKKPFVILGWYNRH